MTPDTVIAAVLICERKRDAFSQARRTMDAVAAMNGLCRMYVNVEGAHPLDIDSFGYKAPFPVVVETWSRSGWIGAQPESDQDQRRLLGIVTARNMAIDYALHQGTEWLLFVDADVAPEPDGLEHLLALGQPLCGGLVPGRGEHARIHYVFPGSMADPDWNLPVTREGNTVRCGFGTCGYMLIHTTLFSRLRFRFNPLSQPGIPAIAEDPAYCFDAIQLGLTDAFYIAVNATATHG